MIGWARWGYRKLDPRRRLAAKVGWLIAGLSLAFAIVAAFWLGSMTRDGMLHQHCRQLALDAEQVLSALEQAIGARVQSLQTLAAILGSSGDMRSPRAVRSVLDQLQVTYPELQWIGFADPSGRILAATQTDPEGMNVTLMDPQDMRAIGQGLRIRAAPDGDPPHSRPIDLAVPVRDGGQRLVGVVLARVRGSWLPDCVQSLRRALRQQGAPDVLLLDRQGRLLTGLPAWRGSVWHSTRMEVIEPSDGVPGRDTTGASLPVVSLERLEDGRRIIAATVMPGSDGYLGRLAWSFALIEPAARANQRADGLWWQILWICLAMGSVAALAGVAMSRQLTQRLAVLSRSVDAVGAGAADRIEVPGGADEIARLGSAFARLLEALQTERASLSALGADLERRVALRTREVERLARESRYAAVVRERLKIARDLHDTLAHSMMAMLTEIRLLKRLHALDPASLSEELAHAEQVAHQGLIEARASITSMRFNPVRDVGLGVALSDTLRRFSERTGVRVETDFDPTAASFAEETAEAVLRIAEEALRNVERHANAGSVKAGLHHLGDGLMVLGIQDDGGGFNAGTPMGGHFGLVGMHEQAQLIGARLTIRSEVHRGTLVSLAFGPGIDAGQGDDPGAQAAPGRASAGC